MTPISAVQRSILEFVARYQSDLGGMPTRVEIARAFGWKSANAAEESLQALERKGYVLLASGRSRGIQLTGKARSLLGIHQPSPLPTGGQPMLRLRVFDMHCLPRGGVVT